VRTTVPSLSLLSLLFVALLHAPPALALDPRFAPLAERLIEDGFALQTVLDMFEKPDAVYDAVYMGKKMRVLYRTRYLPPEPPPPPPPEPRRRIALWEPHLTAEMLANVRVFMQQYQDPLLRAEAEYGVPVNIIVALLVVETKLGEFLGAQMAFKSLASMSVSTEYADIESFVREYTPTPEQLAWLDERQRGKADWAYGEFKALLRYAVDNGLDPTTMPGSIYGAIGLCQFMPSNALRLGKDGDGDGRIDLFSPPDAIASIASFLRNAGWKNSLTRDAQLKVIKRYNPDIFYAKTVLAVAERL